MYDLFFALRNQSFELINFYSFLVYKLEIQLDKIWYKSGKILMYEYNLFHF